MSGDFTENTEQFEGATVELSYYSTTLEERVILGTSVVENGTFEMKYSFDEDVPRHAFLSVKNLEQRREHARAVLVEKNANYTVEVVNEPYSWIRVESDGEYAHLVDVPLEDVIEQRRLRDELIQLIELSRTNDQNDSPTTVDVEPAEGTAREPSAHAAVLDWENMSCEDYSGDFDLFRDRRFFNASSQESDEIRELRQELEDLHMRVYAQPLKDILNTSSDPVERLLVTERTFFLELEEIIPILEELQSELPADVVEERVKPQLDGLHAEQQRRQNNAALKLGTYIPNIDVTLVDQDTVRLRSILQENEIVVLDFWDNYCDSCLRSFRNYRAFYSEYADLQFEIVSLSFEGSFDDWRTMSTELDFPWINTFAPGGRDGEISTLFGIDYPRGNYVLDSEGCILKRDLTPEELRDFLGARLGQ